MHYIKKKIGTITTTHESPTPQKFHFVIDKYINDDLVHSGQFIKVESSNGEIIGSIQNIIKTNKYFQSAEAVRGYQQSGLPLNSIFPTDTWEYCLCETKVLGLRSNNHLERLSIPPSPGDNIYLIDDEELSDLLGLDLKDGINLGKVLYHNLDSKINMTRMFQKHVAILAMSGAGKSYLTSIILEELLKRNKEQGRIAMVLFDVHGEYTSFARENGDEKLAIESDILYNNNLIKAHYVSFKTSNINEYQFANYMPQMSSIQIRELGRILKNLKQNKKQYNLKDIITEIESDELMKSQTKEALISWFYSLDTLNLFDLDENPNLEQSIQPGKLVLFDLSGLTSIKKKQMIVDYVAKNLFYLRKNNKICPFILILEEAHQFIPEGAGKESALARNILETYAREGRKFGSLLCLLSQRPVRLSTTVLSQCGTHIILKITNPYDLDNIRKSSEFITRETLDAISNLPVGEGLIVGSSVNFPLFIKIRHKIMTHSEKFEDLETTCKKFDLN
ncbi:MAG: ATP-binding protein [Candidatus Lokiarchaeota archaeon]|nr:ATP-binding protein [Candidatus Lokiarchaeota archaeon]